MGTVAGQFADVCKNAFVLVIQLVISVSVQLLTTNLRRKEEKSGMKGSYRKKVAVKVEYVHCCILRSGSIAIQGIPVLIAAGSEESDFGDISRMKMLPVSRS